MIRRTFQSPHPARYGVRGLALAFPKPARLRHRRTARSGWILVETMAALMVLSIGGIAMNRAMHEALISVTVSWTRVGRSFERTVETLVSPERIYVEEDEQAGFQQTQ